MLKPRLTALLLLATLAPVLAQTVVPDIAGTWRVETPDGPQEIVVRSDSSASFGEEIVRWRIDGDSLHLALGDEWMVYGLRIGGRTLVLSGGDLEEPVEFQRVGPPTPRPAGVEVPPAPPAERRAIP